jgi:glycosyltransferase involved in cell wall biosynthesis
VDTRIDRLIDCMQSLLDDPAEARRLGEGARRQALERFNIYRYASDWDEAFTEVTGSARKVKATASPSLGENV